MYMSTIKIKITIDKKWRALILTNQICRLTWPGKQIHHDEVEERVEQSGWCGSCSTKHKSTHGVFSTHHLSQWEHGYVQVYLSKRITWKHIIVLWHTVFIVKGMKCVEGVNCHTWLLHLFKNGFVYARNYPTSSHCNWLGFRDQSWI